MTETIERLSDTAQKSNTARWVQATRFAALTIAIWSIALQLSAGVFLPPVAIYGVLFGGLAILLSGERRRLALATGTLGLLALAGNLPGTIDELSHPESAPAFILTLMVSLGAIGTAVSGLAAFRGWSSGPSKAIAISGVGIFVAGILVATVLASSVESADPLASDVTVTAKGVEFDQARLSVPAGISGFWVDNRDGIRHTFTIEAMGFEIDVPAFSTQRADFDLEAGQYIVSCAVPGHENMRIDLTVEG